MKRVVWKDIERLGMLDATVAACVHAQQAPNSGLTREEALMAMVSYLVDDKQALQAEVRSALSRQALLQPVAS